tara:strand:- start:235 stop:609 length:375 start_codon:yes stop_codon:yes gene_type:complete
MSNWNQIKKMDSMLAELYVSIYPDEDVISLEEQVEAKFNAPTEKTTSFTSKISQLTLDIASTEKIIELSFNEEQGQYLFIKCIFKNLSEEQIFFENQQNNNLTVSVVDRVESKDIVITQFKYEL